jgi:hypothetical protein
MSSAGRGVYRTAATEIRMYDLPFVYILVAPFIDRDARHSKGYFGKISKTYLESGKFLRAGIILLTIEVTELKELHSTSLRNPRRTTQWRLSWLDQE